MDDFKKYLEEYREIPHYHGDKVRILFVIAGLLMLFALPFYQHIIPIPIIFSILAILIIGFMAGITNPRLMSIALTDMIISLSGFFIFEYMSISFFDENKLFALVNQILAGIFFIAIYFSTKTLRGFLLNRKS